MHTTLFDTTRAYAGMHDGQLMVRKVDRYEFSPMTFRELVDVTYGVLRYGLLFLDDEAYRLYRQEVATSRTFAARRHRNTLVAADQCPGFGAIGMMDDFIKRDFPIPSFQPIWDPQASTWWERMNHPRYRFAGRDNGIYSETYKELLHSPENVSYASRDNDSELTHMTRISRIKRLAELHRQLIGQGGESFTTKVSFHGAEARFAFDPRDLGFDVLMLRAKDGSMFEVNPSDGSWYVCEDEHGLRSGMLKVFPVNGTFETIRELTSPIKGEPTEREPVALPKPFDIILANEHDGDTDV